mgnify:FL=1
MQVGLGTKLTLALYNIICYKQTPFCIYAQNTENSEIVYFKIYLRITSRLELGFQVSYLQRQKDQIRRLEIALSKAESLFHANNLELQACNAEKIRSAYNCQDLTEWLTF